MEVIEEEKYIRRSKRRLQRSLGGGIIGSRIFGLVKMATISLDKDWRVIE